MRGPSSKTIGTRWRDSWTYGERELVAEAETRAQERVLGTVTMCRGRIIGRDRRGRIVGQAYYYDEYGSPRPERYREVEREVEEEVSNAG